MIKLTKSWTPLIVIAFELNDSKKLNFSFHRHNEVMRVAKTKSIAFCESRSPTQLIRFWGNQKALPDDVASDVLKPQSSAWFDEHPYGWDHISFSQHFAVGVTFDGQMFIWGTKLDGKHTGPKRVLSNRKWQNAKCSVEGIYAQESVTGNVFYFPNVCRNLLSNEEIEAVVEQKIPGLPYANGYNWLYPFGNRKIKNFSVGLNHAAFVDSDGTLYCYGDNSHGQCAAKPPDLTSQNSEFIFKKVVFPEAKTKIKQVSCGKAHTVCIDEKGKAYSFGDDSKIQLGIGDTRVNIARQSEDGRLLVSEFDKANFRPAISSYEYKFDERHLQYFPIEVRQPTRGHLPGIWGPIIAVECGADHTIFQYLESHVKNDEGLSVPTHTLMCTGENLYGQCGRVDGYHQHPQSEVRIGRDLNVKQLSCGANHCVAYLYSKGKIVSWGQNNSGQLGINSRAGGSKARSISLNPNDYPQRILNLLPTSSASWTDIKNSFTTNKESVAVNNKRLINEYKIEPNQMVKVFCGFDNSAVILTNA